MSTNFQFLKKINNNLYEIISGAENLYRDEYFEQCMVQTRRFGEQICKTMLEENGQKSDSFDNMIALLQDKSQGTPQEKEFIDDLYFLKNNGNKAVHSSKVRKDALTALECLKRAFETAINYSVYVKGASNSILKLNYDVELLLTNKKTAPALSEKYEEKKQQQKTEINKTENYREERTRFIIPLFWKLIIFLSGVSFSIIISLYVCISIKKFFN